MIEIPAALAREWASEEEWLADLPRLAAECAEQWGVRLEHPIDTPHSLVVPAGETVLKLNAPSHVEVEHEADALALWDGRGAVRLLARDDAGRALLLERCRPGTRLGESDVDGIDVVLELIERVPDDPGVTHPFRLLGDEAARWAEEVPLRRDQAGRPFDRSLLDRALDVFATVDRTASALANQDLHAANILRATREPWLVIDPKPLVGEPELDGVGLLRNAAWSGGPVAVRRWLDALAGLGLDRERLRGWGVAHALAWGAVDAARAIARA